MTENPAQAYQADINQISICREFCCPWYLHKSGCQKFQQAARCPTIAISDVWATECQMFIDFDDLTDYKVSAIYHAIAGTLQSLNDLELVMKKNRGQRRN